MSPPTAGGSGTTGTGPSAGMSPSKEAAVKNPATGRSDDGVRVRVYKPDGSRQCERRAGTPVDLMERELAGIRVHAREKRKDGLMHIQVCGSPSGVINVFEIDAGFSKQAEERGFKRLED